MVDFKKLLAEQKEKERLAAEAPYQETERAYRECKVEHEHVMGVCGPTGAAPEPAPDSDMEEVVAIRTIIIRGTRAMLAAHMKRCWLQPEKGEVGSGRTGAPGAAGLAYSQEELPRQVFPVRRG